MSGLFLRHGASGCGSVVTMSSVPTASAPEAPPTTVAFLGPAGTFTEAALWLFDAQKASHQRWSGLVKEIPAGSPAEALDAVRRGRADYACVAIENSIDGVVTATMDALSDSTGADSTGAESADTESTGAAAVQVFAEVDVPVEFAVLSRKFHNIEDCANQAPGSLTLSTHPVAYQQVKEWIAQYLPQVEFIPASSNGAAAQSVAEGAYDIAVAPLRAAEVFGLHVLAQKVADHPGAKTRFLLVGKPDVPTARTGNDRTSVTFLAANEPGSLVACLSEFAQRGVDLSRIESRPTKTQMGSYRFFADLVGHIDDAPVAEALRALYLRTPDVRFLGSWPSVEPAQAVDADQDRLVRAARWVDNLRAGRRR